MDYNDWPQEEQDTLEEHIQDELYEEEPYEQRVLTPEEKVELDKLCEENPTMKRNSLAKMILINLEIRLGTEAFNSHMFTRLYHVPPSQIEGTYNSTLQSHSSVDYELSSLKELSSSLDTSMCIREASYRLENSLLIDECCALISESEKLESLKIERLSRNYHEVCFDIDYLNTLNAHELSITEQSSSLLEKSDLGDETDIDRILNEIDNPTVEMKSREENIVHYVVDGDEVDYFFIDSFEHEVDFIFPLNAFDPLVHSTIKEAFRLYDTLLVDVLDYNFSSLPWKIVSLFALFVPCFIRRRTKGRLAQPFDSHD